MSARRKILQDAEVHADARGINSAVEIAAALEAARLFSICPELVKLLGGRSFPPEQQLRVFQVHPQDVRVVSEDRTPSPSGLQLDSPLAETRRRGRLRFYPSPFSLPRVLQWVMTTDRAILIGAAIIGGSIVLSRVVAPYEVSSAPGGTPVIWRANTVTGDVTLCQAAPGEGRIVFYCR